MTHDSQYSVKLHYKIIKIINLIMLQTRLGSNSTLMTQTVLDGKRLKINKSYMAVKVVLN
jgi:hypothetical protein